MRSLIVFALLCKLTATENLYSNDSATFKEILTKRQAPTNDIISLDLDSPSDIHIKIIKEKTNKNLYQADELPIQAPQKQEELEYQDLIPSGIHNRPNYRSDDYFHEHGDGRIKINHEDESHGDKRNMYIEVDGEPSIHVSQKHSLSNNEAFKTIDTYGNLPNHGNYKNLIYHDGRTHGRDQGLENEGIMLVAVDDESPIHVLQNYRALVDKGFQPINIDNDVYGTIGDSSSKEIDGGDQMNHEDKKNIVKADHDQTEPVKVDHDQINQVNSEGDGVFSKIKDESSVNLPQKRGGFSNDKVLKTMNSSDVERNFKNNFAKIVQRNHKNNSGGGDLNSIGVPRKGDFNSNNIRNENNYIQGDNINRIVGKNVDDLSLISGHDGNLNQGSFNDDKYFGFFKDHAKHNLELKDLTKNTDFGNSAIDQKSYNDDNNVKCSTDYGNYVENFDEMINLGDNENHTNIQVANYGKDLNNRQGSQNDQINNYGNRIDFENHGSFHNDKGNQEDERDDFNVNKSGKNFNINHSKQQEIHNSHDISTNNFDFEDGLNHQGDKFYDKHHEDHSNDQEIHGVHSNNDPTHQEEFENNFNNQGNKFSDKNNGKYENDLSYKGSKFSDRNYGNYKDDPTFQGRSKFDKKNHEHHENDLNHQDDTENHENLKNNLDNEGSEFDNKNGEKYENDLSHEGNKFDIKDHESLENNINQQRNKFVTKNEENYDKNFPSFQGNNYRNKINTKLDDFHKTRQESLFGNNKINNEDKFNSRKELESYNRHKILMDAIRNRFRGTTGGYFEEKTERISSENDGKVEFSPTKSSKPICQDVAPQAHCIKEEDKYFCKIGKSSYTIYTGVNSSVSSQVIEDYVRSMFMKYGEGDRCLDMSQEPGKHGPCLKSKMPVDNQMPEYSQTSTKLAPGSKRGPLNIICTPIGSPSRGADCRNSEEIARDVIYACRWRTPNKIIDC